MPLPIQQIKKYKNVIVTGPQRSGTRICSKIIADETGWRYIDEREHGNDLARVKDHLEKQSVIQLPTFMHLAHTFPKDTLVAVMIRDTEDVRASQERINWSKASELDQLKFYGKEEGIISEIKYKYWFEYQKPKMDNYLEVPYESLKYHRFWRDNRKHFKWSQTE